MNILQIETLVKLAFSKSENDSSMILESLGFIVCGFTVNDRGFEVEYKHSGYIVAIMLTGKYKNVCEIWHNGMMIKQFYLNNKVWHKDQYITV